MNKRRICVLCETWASGGIESFLANVLFRQEMPEMEIDLVAAAKYDSIYTARLQEHSIRIVTLSGSSWKLLENWHRFRSLLTERKYDVVYVNAFQALTLRYGLLARRAGVPVRILHSHNSDIRSHTLRLPKLLIHRISMLLYKGVGTELFACSDEAADFLFPASLRERGLVRIIPNGIETERFRFQGETRDLIRSHMDLEDCLVLGHVGRLCIQKNQVFLMKVLKALITLRPEARLLLIGEGELRETLEKKAEELQIRDYVLFYGVTDKPQELLWAMDVFLFPSLFEGLGIAAVEAQCAGVPLVCSEHIPQQALITDLVHRIPLNSGAEAWAKAIDSMGKPDCREKYADEVKRAGYDVEDVSRILHAVLMGETG